MKELSKKELILIDGGNVPTSYYMDSDTIKANWRLIKEFLKSYALLVSPLDIF